MVVYLSVLAPTCYKLACHPNYTTIMPYNVIDFVPCSGWLGRFKRRHWIIFKAASGEAASVDMSTVETWRGSALKELLQLYKHDDIFNADKTGIFFKCLPDKTLDFKGAICTGGKKAKDRLTVLVAANMSGKEKLPLSSARLPSLVVSTTLKVCQWIMLQTRKPG